MDRYNSQNCCRIPYFICSLLVCIIFLFASVFALIVGLVFPEHLLNIYMIGETALQVRLAVGFLVPILIIANISLAYGIAKTWALFILLWILANIIMWNIHFILFVCSFSIAMINIEACEHECSYYLLFIFTICVFWIICIIQVSKHWYALCEEIYIQEYGQRPGQVSHYRMLSVSNRTRLNASAPNLINERIPDVLQRIER